MDYKLIMLAIVFLVMAYLVGVKKQVWLLSGFNQKRVKDKDKLAKMVGSYDALIGIVLLIGAVIDYSSIQIIILIMFVGFVILIVYVNIKMVE